MPLQFLINVRYNLCVCAFSRQNTFSWFWNDALAYIIVSFIALFVVLFWRLQFLINAKCIIYAFALFMGKYFPGPWDDVLVYFPFFSLPPLGHTINQLAINLTRNRISRVRNQQCANCKTEHSCLYTSRTIWFLNYFVPPMSFIYIPYVAGLSLLTVHYRYTCQDIILDTKFDNSTLGILFQI